jgi:hypothetical protein
MGLGGEKNIIISLIFSCVIFHIQDWKINVLNHVLLKFVVVYVLFWCKIDENWLNASFSTYKLVKINI